MSVIWAFVLCTAELDLQETRKREEGGIWVLKNGHLSHTMATPDRGG
jgi:hypothetical protein